MPDEPVGGWTWLAVEVLTFLDDLIGLMPWAKLFDCLPAVAPCGLAVFPPPDAAACVPESCWLELLLMACDRLFWTTRKEVSWNSEGVFRTLLMMF